MAPKRKTTIDRPLHPLELRILMVLMEEPSYGTRIVEEVEARESGRIKLYPANLYRRIRDLLTRGLLEEAEAPAGADPRRTYLQITPMGRIAAREEAQRFHELVEDAARLRLLRER